MPMKTFIVRQSPYTKAVFNDKETAVAFAKKTGVTVVTELNLFGEVKNRTVISRAGQ